MVSKDLSRGSVEISRMLVRFLVNSHSTVEDFWIEVLPYSFISLEFKKNLKVKKISKLQKILEIQKIFETR